jgi:putative FmdB family regulatory protein
MPIYEYRCGDCRHKVSIFWRSFSTVDETQARCTFCGSARLSRLASRVRVIRGGSRDTAAPSAEGGDVDDGLMGELGGLDENDPRQLGHFMRKMAAETGEAMGPEFDEIVGRLEKGEDPEKIEQSMGDVLGGPPGGDDMMDDDMGMGGMTPPQPEAPGEPTEAADKAGVKPATKAVRPRKAAAKSARSTGRGKSRKGSKTKA